MKRTHARLVAASLLALIAAQVVAPALAGVSAIQPSQGTPVKVLCLTQRTNGEFEVRLALSTKHANVSRTIAITWALESNYTTQTALLNTYDVIIVNSFLPNDATFIANLASAVAGGVGLFFFGGYYPILAEALGASVKAMLPVLFNEPFTVEEETYVDQGWVSQIELKVNADHLFNETAPNNVGLLQRSVVWESSPLVKERIFVRDSTADANVLVYRPQQGRKASEYNCTDGEPLVAFRQHGAGRVLWVSMGTGFINSTFALYTTTGVGPYWNRTIVPGSSEKHNKIWNQPWHLWPYFNYFLYQSSMYLAGKVASDIDTYAKWPHSPIPHEAEAFWWMVFVGGLWVFNFVLFFTLGRKKKGEPRQAPAPAPAGGEDSKDKPAGEKAGESTPSEPASEPKVIPEPEPAKDAGGDSLLRKADSEGSDNKGGDS